MWTRWLLLAGILGVGAAGAAGPTPATTPRLSVRVDARVELLSIIFRLAGNPEYNPGDIRSKYADEVEAHFGRFRDHRAVRMAQRLRERRGISYDAVVSLAVHLADANELQPAVPLRPRPARLDRRWRPRDVRYFLKAARGFVRESGFKAFFERHAALYRAAEARLRAVLDGHAVRPWLDSFFGRPAGTQVVVTVGMLTGHHSYSVGVKWPDGRERIVPVIGAERFDAQGVPLFDDTIVPVLVHEMAHAYVGPLVRRYEEKLRPAAERMWPYCREAMKRQAYGDWQTMMNESLVRACVVRYRRAHEGPAAARQSVDQARRLGFEWVGELADLLGEYESQREQYGSFDAFMPQVVELFERYATRYERRKRVAPRVVSMIPANGATDVDPSLREIRITFDRPMDTLGWSLCGGGPEFPKIAGRITYDDTATTLIVPVRLEPGHTYRFSLNCPSAQNFRSREGVPLEPVLVTFRTRDR